MKEYPRNDVEFIRIGYHDCCINFRVTFREYSRETCRFVTLKQAIRAAGQYNEFDPDTVITALDKISGLVQQIDFGREGSPVMYLHLNRAVWDAVKETWRDLRAAKLRSFENQVKAAFTDTQFDEFDREANVIRIWWD